MPYPQCCLCRKNKQQLQSELKVKAYLASYKYFQLVIFYIFTPKFLKAVVP